MGNANRRQFLKGAAVGVGYFVAQQYSRGQEGTSPSDKLNIAVVGTAHQADYNIKELNKTGLANLVAFVDVDDRFLGGANRAFPKARVYHDFRDMLEQKDVDAVLTAIPDHMHAWVTLAAMRAGKHVYCEKPLAHSVEEVRMVTRTAKELKRVTQMGTQIHAQPNYRRVVELVQGGAIGAVKEVHVFIDKAWFQDKPERKGVELPPGLHWNLWLGPVPPRPFSPDYLPEVWRRWWAFGEGTIGDMACHWIDLPKWALKLGNPTKIKAEGPEPHKLWCPKSLIAHYEFPAREDLPPVKLTWYDGGQKPADLLKELKLEKWKNGTLFVGEKGYIITDYDKHKLLPEEKFVDFTPPEQTIPASVGHHKEWILACMKNEPEKPLCNFSYSGPLSEAVLLGAVSHRAGNKELVWDAENLTTTNAPEAEEFIKLKYRAGWSLKG
ncbi:MAG TPA: Gfo/Idh/MocA family oxidoreductase [Tepidisphaeraceae bacterium]|jgi:predicted dehydrogenase